MKRVIAQDETVRFLLGGDVLVVGVREFAEIVEHAAHMVSGQWSVVSGQWSVVSG